MKGRDPTELSAPVSFFERHRKKTLFVVLLFVVPVADIVGTAVLRAAGLYVPAARAGAGVRRSHPVYHHGLAPRHTDDDVHWGGRRHAIHTNSLGFKDAAPREVALRGTSRRILLIGDSFTEGIGVNFQDTFAGILAEDLSARGIEVLNAGVASYSPIIYAAKCRHLLEAVGLRFDHLVVCLDMSDVFDEARIYRSDSSGRVARIDGGWDQALKNFVRDNTILCSAVRRWIRRGRHEQRGPRAPLGLERSSWTRDPRLWREVGEPGLALASRHLDDLRRCLGEHEIDMTLVVYPWPDQILHREADCAQVTRWREWADERGVDFCNLFPAFLEAGEPIPVIERHFIPGDMHWNENGHELVARALGRHLDEALGVGPLFT